MEATMPANIAKDKYGYLSVYADEKPWHPEVGVIVIGARDALGVIKASRAKGGQGLGFTVDTAPAYAKVGGRFVEATDHRAIYRVDTKDVFGFASPDYKPIQNLDALRLPEAIVGTKQAGWISVGAIGNGAKLFATLDLSKLADVKIPGDPSKFKTLLSCTWSHDALEALRIGFSMRRLECANMRKMQLGAWDSGRDLSVRIIHAGDIAAQTKEAQRILGFAAEAIRDHTKLMAQLTEIAVSQKWLDDEFLPLLIPIPQEMERAAGREEARAAISHLYKSSKNLHGVPATAYRALQAVDEYADHHRPMRSADSEIIAARRMRALLGEGPTASLKDMAIRLLREQFEIGKVLVPVKAAKK
jgi:phage/plasmid-like protein (TIGR03299 family)